ncbi:MULTISPECIES: LysR substrate-binding domain-containing protein [Photobacterium]|uniref:LysR family transcriptional regulator n=1 Tax=Photobacterium halotolerans TaxID=265726 RepID=A0A0F5VB43_9GAMM|nr:MULTISPECIES: LysR substrate-binding domain-containing protein [Photobacterium]KKC98704.1 LysR family transcriptional regulator [Photobacterium halotolerans]UIP27822.1 LysR substrate-binding domain-containing protein [Photobacterium sp. TLY01]
MNQNKTLDPVLLRSFVAVVDSGSFTRAADSTHLTQSTVSQQVRKLESQLGCELLHRKGRYVTATLEGERVLNYARRILQLMSEAVVQTSVSAEQQKIRLGVPEDFATHAIMPTLHAFSTEFPGIRLEVKSGLCSDIWRKFQSNELDLALVKQRQGSLPGLASWPEPLCWIDSLHSNNLDRQPVPLVSFPIGGLYRNEMAHTFDSLGRSWRLAYVSTSLSGVCCAVEAGLGISLLPRRLVTEQHRILDENDGLPPVQDMEVTLHTQEKVSALSKILAERLINTCDRIFEHDV